MVTTGLAGKRILVVEDEYFIAADLKRALGQRGAAVVGPVADLAAGLEMARTEPLDAAILDVNLEGAFSYPLADRLAAAGVPHLFLTGYDPWALPEAYRDRPRVAKPFVLGALIETVERLFG